MAEAAPGETPANPPGEAPGAAPGWGLAARQIMRAAPAATLATAGEGGQPFAALVTPAVAPDGSILLWLSRLSEHTRQLGRDARCALLFTAPAAEANPQTAPRVSVTGLAERLVAEEEVAALKPLWLARHPYAALYAGFRISACGASAPAGG